MGPPIFRVLGVLLQTEARPNRLLIPKNSLEREEKSVPDAGFATFDFHGFGQSSAAMLGHCVKVVYRSVSIVIIDKCKRGQFVSGIELHAVRLDIAEFRSEQLGSSLQFLRNITYAYSVLFVLSS